MNQNITTFARYTLLEAMRTRLPQLALAAIALLLEQSYWVLRFDVPEANFLQPGLLAIGSREEGKFLPAQGTELLIFLGRVLGLSIRSWLDLPDGD